MEFVGGRTNNVYLLDEAIHVAATHLPAGPIPNNLKSGINVWVTSTANMSLPSRLYLMVWISVPVGSIRLRANGMMKVCT